SNSNSRCCILFQVDSRDSILQSLIIYDVLIKRKISLDHLRSGLKTNGVLDLFIQFPSIAKRIMMYDEELDAVTPASFIESIDFSHRSVNLEDTVIFKEVIRQLDAEQLKELLRFVSGASDLTAVRGRKISLEICQSLGVFSSSCSFKFTIPRGAMRKKEDLVPILLAMDSGNFNTV
uniref:Uncharacterized protein n=1 Tax=Clytia hemisphaerica TaxID=252671 RepID=A0A7M5UXV6_9CNID